MGCWAFLVLQTLVGWLGHRIWDGLNEPLKGSLPIFYSFSFYFLFSEIHFIFHKYVKLKRRLALRLTKGTKGVCRLKSPYRLKNYATSNTIWNQTSLVKTQLTKICCTVSSAWSQSREQSGWSKPRRANRSAVQHRFKAASQRKNLHLGGAHVVQILLAGSNETALMKKRSQTCMSWIPNWKGSNDEYQAHLDPIESPAEYPKLGNTPRMFELAGFP
jgi:hypothetical protein